MKRAGVGIFAAVAWLTLVAVRAGPGGDISNHYTDHLRHMGESLILLERGFELYRSPYGPLARAVGVPCDDHLGLFEDRTAPYPPMGVLLHAPWALAERAQWLSSQTAHQGVVLMWSLVALFAVALLLSLLEGAPWVAWAGALFTLVPLLLGTAANGFFDVAFACAGIAGLVAWKHRHVDLAVVCLALAGALHFRALVFLVPGVALVFRGAKWPTLATVVALLLPALAAGATVASTLGTIPAHNPLHFSHGNRSLAAFGVATAMLAAVLVKRQAWLTFGMVVGASVLATFERSHGYWHALPMALSALGAALEAKAVSRGTWGLLWAWVWVSGAITHRTLEGPFWSWVSGALHRSVAE